MTETHCEKCGTQNWTTDSRYGKLVCIDCGWQPRDPKEQEIRDALPPGAIDSVRFD